MKKMVRGTITAKRFMARHGIPTAHYATFTDAREAHAWVDERGAPIVVTQHLIGDQQAASAQREPQPDQRKQGPDDQDRDTPAAHATRHRWCAGHVVHESLQPFVGGRIRGRRHNSSPQRALHPAGLDASA